MEQMSRERLKGRFTNLFDAVDFVISDVRQLLTYKNSQYEDSFAKLREEYPEYLSMRLTDKLNRLKTQKKNGSDYTDTLFDIAGYCVLELAYIALEESNGNKNKT